MADYKLTYYNIRGLAEPTRYLFAMAGVPYEDVRIPYDPASSLPKDIKDNTPWGQVPVLEYKGELLAQASAIARFVAKRFNLAGRDEFEAAKCDEYVDAMKDFCIEAFRAIRLEQDLAKKAAIKVTMMATVIPKYLQKFEDILSRSKSGWLVGDGVTWADVYVCVYISLNTDFHQLPLLDGYPALGKMYATLHAIPEIKDWVEKRPKTNT
ncbi:hematopoietic prostaglandin D synthase [Folsomia candida]|uniref:glutathione transferase n=1 Tax=Folsomia candida TaxID=158441 RepID=A0A226DXQ6_FOLCA|nr:hematopoietic prostaglandin D synthase [Folsomia candida]OXA49471.1 Glutathione S-transferase 1 [Folsomia candida]